MKKYSLEKLDTLLEGDNARTIKTEQTRKGTLYLDALNNGEFAVSNDETNKGIFSNIIEADSYFCQVVSVSNQS